MSVYLFVYRLSVCLSVCRLPVVCLLYCSIYRHTLNVASSSSPMVPRTVWLSSSMLTTFARPTSKLLKPARYQSLQLYEREEGRGYFTEYTSNIFHIISSCSLDKPTSFLTENQSIILSSSSHWYELPSFPSHPCF